jgi:hypothetical protein
MRTASTVWRTLRQTLRGAGSTRRASCMVSVEPPYAKRLSLRSSQAARASPPKSIPW